MGTVANASPGARYSLRLARPLVPRAPVTNPETYCQADLFVFSYMTARRLTRISRARSMVMAL